MARPKSGSLESTVAWLVSHGRNIGQIIDAVQNKYRSPNLTKTTDYANKYAEKYGRNILPSLLRPLSSRTQAQLAKQGFARGFIRCTIDATWLSPLDGETRDGTWWVDVPAGLTGSQQYQYVLNALYQRFNQEYKGNMTTLSQVPKFIQGISIRECE